MRVFIINLDSRPDRLREISAELAKISLPFERVAAVDGQMVTLSTLVDHWRERIYLNFTKPHPGAVGCWASHRAIWKKMIDENIDSALIFEDDALVEGWNPAILDIDLAALNLDQLRLEATPTKVKRTHSMDGTKIAILDRVAVNRPSFGTAAYIITAEGARKSLQVEKFWFHVDRFEVVKHSL